MELNSQHREALLQQLDQSNEKLELASAIIRTHPDATHVQWREIDMFLEQQRIQLIKTSLIDNDIDY